MKGQQGINSALIRVSLVSSLCRISVLRTFRTFRGDTPSYSIVSVDVYFGIGSAVHGHWTNPLATLCTDRVA